MDVSCVGQKLPSLCLEVTARVINVNFTFCSPCIVKEHLCLSWRIKLPPRIKVGRIDYFPGFGESIFPQNGKDSFLGCDL